MRLQPYYSIGKKITSSLDYHFDECIIDYQDAYFCHLTVPLIIIRYLFALLVVYQLIIVYLPNTSSVLSSSTSASSSSSRSNMQNPCPSRARPISQGDTEFLSTSLWKSCLQECHLSPMEEADALVQLVTQTNELQQTFNHFKDRFVRF